MERTSRRDARARVVGVLAEAGAVSRADLARRAALAPSTVSAVVSDLQAAGLVVEPAEPVHPPERGTRRPPAGADRAASQGRRGRRHGLRQAPSAAGDLRPLHALLAERHRALDADLPAKRGDRARPAMFADALEEAEVHATRSRRRHGPAGPGAPPLGRARQLDDPAGLGRDPRRGRGLRGARPPRRGRERRQPRRARRVDVGRRPRRRPHGLRQGRDRHRRRVHRRRPAVRRRRAGRPASSGTPSSIRGGPICRCGNRGCLETLRRRPGDPRLAARCPRRRA